MPHPAQISPDEPRDLYEPWNHAGSADDDRNEEEPMTTAQEVAC